MVDRARDGAVPLPPEFFQQVLPAVRDLAELKVALYTALFAGRPETPYAVLDEYLQMDVARDIAGISSPEPLEIRVQRALDRAVANGTILRLALRSRARREVRYLPATDHHRRWLAESAVAEDSGDASPPEPLVSIYRPNVYALFERYIGPLTPLVAEQVRDAERLYPREWLEMAFAEAAQLHQRSWRYVQTVLSSWERNGGPGPRGD